MEVTNQTNPNECGICVINSLVHHFYRKSNKLAILNDANMTNEGLSIFNFEYLAQQYGIFVETFQLSWAEFTNLKNNEYMVCPIKKMNGLHYVIIKKHKYTIEVYDSSEGKYQIDLKRFGDKFMGIIMMVSKSATKINVDRLPKIDLWHSLDWKYLLVSLLMQIAIVLLGAISADYFNIMINHAIASKSIRNGLTIMMIFGVFFILEGLLHYVLSLYSAKHFKINFQYLSHQLLHSLKLKNKTFFHKVDSNYFYLVDTAIHSITVFITTEVTTLCSNCILIVVIMCTVAIISPWFLLITLIAIVLAIIFNTIHYYYRKHMVKVGLENQRTNNSITHHYIDYFKTQNNYLIQNELSDKLEHNYTEFQRIYLSQVKFNGAFNFFEGMSHNFIYLLLIMVGCYLIVEFQNINIGELTFIISLIGMVSGAFNGLCGFMIKRIEYLQMSEIYKNFITLGNREIGKGIKIDKINKLKVNDKVLYSGKEYKNGANIIKTLLLEEKDSLLYLNETTINNFDLQNYFEQLFVINHDTKMELGWLHQHFDQNNTIFLKTLEKFNINLTSLNYLNIYEQTLVNILSSMLIQNKLIIFNDCLKYVTKEHLVWIKKVVIPYLKEDNFVLILENV